MRLLVLISAPHVIYLAEDEDIPMPQDFNDFNDAGHGKLIIETATFRIH